MADRSPSEDRGEPVTAPSASLVALVVAHHATVYRYACRLCGCPTEAEDLAQQTFLIVQQKLHQLREPERACAWLLAIVRSVFLKGCKKLRPMCAEDVDLPL